jgi:transcriptional regulator with XRE-family HTH domain
MENQLAIQLREARERRGQSQRDTAYALGIWPNTVSRWELGRSVIQGRNLRRLEELYPEIKG